MSCFARFRPLLGVAAATLLACVVPASRAAATADRTWTWPLSPRPTVVAAFDPPDSPYGAGNRGVDLLGAVGEPVLAIGDGEVTYAGVLAGRGVVVISHGAVRSTYEPVSATVSVGDLVLAGDPVGALASVGSHCPPQACLHLGIIHGSVYLDPLSLLPHSQIRLKPVSGDSIPMAMAMAMAMAAAPPAAGAAAVAVAGYRWPTVR
jgi:murein DD-endopeptidase MepM/ murein hydrolase activator NlpD